MLEDKDEAIAVLTLRARELEKKVGLCGWVWVFWCVSASWRADTREREREGGIGEGREREIERERDTGRLTEIERQNEIERHAQREGGRKKEPSECGSVSMQCLCVSLSLSPSPPPFLSL